MPCAAEDRVKGSVSSVTMVDMKLLVLGGGSFVGRAIVEEALHRGDEVTTVSRGLTGTPVPGVVPLRADRLCPGDFAAALGDQGWDAVVDTWSGAPAVVRESAQLLRDRVGHYGYVSSRSVYTWPIPRGADESAPVVDASPESTDTSSYAAAKRGGELAVLASFPTCALLARPGLILGPREDVGRLPWWLDRVARGDRVPAPGPQDLPLQYVDARDLAAFMIDAAHAAVTGAFNVVSRRGHATMGSLLDACADTVGSGAELVWLPLEVVEAAGVTGWVDLPIWVPPEGEIAALHDGDVTAALDAGLACRPVEETVADTWAWLQAVGAGRPQPRAPLGVSPEVEQALTAAMDALS